MVVRAKIGRGFGLTRSTKLRVGIINAVTRGGFAVLSALARGVRRLAHDVAQQHARPHTVAMVDRAMIGRALDLAGRTERRIRVRNAEARRRIARFTALAGRIRRLAGHVADRHARPVSVAFLDRTQVSVRVARRADRRVRIVLAEARARYAVSARVAGSHRG